MSLAQMEFGSDELIRVLVLIGVMIVLVVLAGVGLLLYRRSLFSSSSDHAREQTSSLFESLREMHAQGVLSDEEYQLARHRLAGRAVRSGSIADQHGGSRSSSSVQPITPAGEASSVLGVDRELRAPPGFDLTGEPLPDPADYPDDACD